MKGEDRDADRHWSETNSARASASFSRCCCRAGFSLQPHSPGWPPAAGPGDRKVSVYRCPFPQVLLSRSPTGPGLGPPVPRSGSMFNNPHCTLSTCLGWASGPRERLGQGWWRREDRQMPFQKACSWPGALTINICEARWSHLCRQQLHTLQATTLRGPPCAHFRAEETEACLRQHSIAETHISVCLSRHSLAL